MCCDSIKKDTIKLKNHPMENFSFNQQLDVDFLQSLYEDDYEYAQQVFGNFLIETNKELALLKEFEFQNDQKKFRAHLHKIKPTFSLVGVSSLTQFSETVISQCDNPEKNIFLEPCYHDWNTEVSRWMPIIEEEYKRLQNHIIQL